MHSKILTVVVAAVALMGCPSPMMNTGGGGGGGSAGGSATGGGSGGGSATGGGTATGGGAAMGGGSGGGGMMGTRVTCTNPIAIASAGMVNGDTSTNANSYSFSPTGSCVTASDAPDTVYSISVPDGQRLKATVDNNQFDVTINIIAPPATNCGTTADSDGGSMGVVCASGGDSNDPAAAETAFYTNHSGAAQTVFIMIDGYSDTEMGPFRLTTTIAAPPAGDDCTTAVTAAAGTTAAQTLADYSDDYHAGLGCEIGTLSNDRVYKVSVPAGNRLTATVTGDAQADGGGAVATTLNLVTGTCTPTLTCENGSNASGVQTAVYDNIGSGAVDVFMVVDTSVTDPTGTFSLNVALAAMSFSVGEVCGNAAAAITATTTLSSQSFSGYVSNYDLNGGNACLYSEGPDRAYAVDIPAGQVLHAVATPGGADGGPNIALNIVDSTQACGSGDCITSSDSSGVESVNVSNAGGSAVRHVHVVVDSNDLTPMAGYSLALTIAPPPAGDSCTTATAIAAPGVMMNETTVGFSNDYSPTNSSTGCTDAPEDGSDHVYSISVPAGKTLSVTVSPAGTNASAYDPGVYIIASPDTNCIAMLEMCLAGADTGLEGIDETTTYMNSTTSAQTVFIVVDSFTAFGAPGEITYNLTTAIQ